MYYRRSTMEVAKRSEPHAFAVISMRWVVERAISWLKKYRRLWENCERKLVSLKVLEVFPPGTFLQPLPPSRFRLSTFRL